MLILAASGYLAQDGQIALGIFGYLVGFYFIFKGD
jgi:hypothetical protein